MRTLISVLQCGPSKSTPIQNGQSGGLTQNTDTPLLEKPQAWCQCGCCPSAAPLHEQLCCRLGKGRCITTSPIFSTLILNRSILETALFYVDPLAELNEGAELRHGAYSQFIRWRFGDSTPRDAVPVIPSCCVGRIRAEYPSPDGKYSGLRLHQATLPQAEFNVG